MRNSRELFQVMQRPFWFWSPLLLTSRTQFELDKLSVLSNLEHRLETLKSGSAQQTHISRKNCVHKMSHSTGHEERDSDSESGSDDSSDSGSFSASGVHPQSWWQVEMDLGGLHISVSIAYVDRVKHVKHTYTSTCLDRYADTHVCGCGSKWKT